MEIDRNLLNSNKVSVGYYRLIKKEGEFYWQQKWAFSHDELDSSIKTVSIDDNRLKESRAAHENKYPPLSGSGFYLKEAFCIPFVDGDI